MKDLYGTEESFETVRKVAIQDMLDVSVIGWDIVVPYSCFYPCETHEELQEKVLSLGGWANVKVG